MLIKLIKEYAKYVFVCMIIGFVGWLVYFFIAGKTIQNSTVIRYKTVAPKLDEKARSHLPNKHAPLADETSDHQDPQPRATLIESDTDFIEDSPETETLETETAETPDDLENVPPHKVGGPGEMPELSAGDLRRQEMVKRQALLREQLQEMLPIDGIAEPERALQAINLQQEIYRIGKELGTVEFSGGDPMVAFEINKLVLSNLTPDGEIPVSIGTQFAELLEKSGEKEIAAGIRRAMQRAVENGDTVFKREHIEGIR